MIFDLNIFSWNLKFGCLRQIHPNDDTINKIQIVSRVVFPILIAKYNIIMTKIDFKTDLYVSLEQQIFKIC